MATIPSYPKANAGPEDLLLGINVIPDAGVDAPKTRSFPVSSIISLATAAVAPDISGKEDVINKSTSIYLGTSNILYPTQNAVKTYVDNNVPTIQPVSATETGVVNNTSLQELGGVDKTINGVRIGVGNLLDPLAENTAFGYQALQSVVHTTEYTGYYNSAFGYEALKSLTTGYQNDAFGDASLSACTTGTYNIAVGAAALGKLTTGFGNSGIGSATLFENISGQRNTAIGAAALARNIGSNNTAIGYYAAGLATSSGNWNIAIGMQAGRDISTGSNNLLIENITNASITSGSFNIVLNPKQKSGVTTGSFNTIIGCWDGAFPSAMANNVIIGDGQGNIRFRTTDTGLTTVPGQTNALITADTTGKAVVTKEYISGVVKPYKVYTALLSQSGITAPVATVLENTLGFNLPLWLYNFPGEYRMYKPELNIANKVALFIGQTGYNNAVFHFYQQGDNLYLETRNSSSNRVNDLISFPVTIEIRVYN